MTQAARLPFRTKVTLHTMMTALVALALVGVSVVAYDRIQTREAVEQRLLSDADGIASDVTSAALQFDERVTMEEQLRALQHQPEVTIAAIYDDAGKLAASFTPGDIPAPAQLPAITGLTYRDQHLAVVRPIRLPTSESGNEGRVIGHVYLRRNMQDLRERLWQYIGIVTLVLGAALVVTMITTHFFTRVLTRPIGELVDTAARVTETQDYTLRAAKLSEDELGRLTDAFNQMLAQIQQREAVVRDREHRFTTYMNNSPAVAWMKDADFRYVYMNDTYEQRFGINLADFWGRTDYDLYPAAVADELRENDRHVIETGETMETIETVPTPDGVVREWIVVKFPFTDENGRMYSGGMAFEITERVEAQRKLEHSEALYRSLVDHVPQAIFRKDLDGRITFANRQLADLIDTPLDDVLNKNDADLLGPELAARFAEEDRRVIETGEVIENDVEFDLPPHGPRILHQIKTPLQDSAGRVIGVQGIAWDITDRMRAVEALQRSKADLAMAQAIAHVGSWTWNPATNKVSLSDELMRIYGVDPEDFDGTYDYLLEHVIHPEDRQLLIESSVRGAEGEAKPMEFRVVHRDGSVRLVRADAEVVLDDDGRVAQMFGTVQDITEQRAAEEALRQSEEKYRRIVETAQEGIWVLDAEACTTFVNPRMAEMLGYTAEDMMGRSMYDFMDDRARLEAEQNWSKRRQGVSESHTFRFTHRDGHDVWTLLSANPLTDDTGRFVGALGMVTDITEQRHAEAAIKELEERLHTVVSNTPMVLFAIDREGRFILSEGRGLEVLGLKSGQVVGQSVFDLYADYPDIIESINRALDGEAHTAVTVVDDVYFETQFSPLLDERDEVDGVIGVAINITDRLQAEVALRQSEQLNRSIVENVPGGIVRVNPDGSILHANTEAQSFLGLTLDKLTNRYVSDWDAETIREDGSHCPVEQYPVSKCLATGQPASGMTIGIRRPNGETRWGVFSAVPHHDARTGELTGAVVTFLDITDRKRAEQELEYHVEFERLITSISTDLLNLEPEQIDNALHDALRRIGRFVGVDRCYMLVYDASQRQWIVNDRHQWTDAERGVDAPMTGELHVDQVPWASERSLTGHIIQVRNLDELPPDAEAERQRWREQHIVSLISVPVFTAGTVYGVLAMETVERETALSEDVLTLLQIAGENLANALQRKETEQSLRESQRTLSTLMSNLPGMAYRCRNDADWSTIFISEGCLKLTGYAPEDLMHSKGVSFGKQIIHPDDQAPVWKRVQKAIAEYRPFRLIYRILTRDGQTKWVWEQGQAVYNDQGEVETLEGFITDITERRQAEQAMRNSERRLELVLEATNEGVWDWNIKSGEVHYSRRWIESLGYEAEEVTPHISFWDGIVHPDDKAAVDAALRDHFEGRTPVYQCENRLRMKNGRYRWNLDRGKVVKWDGKGKPVRMVGTDTDITARKEAEQTKATLEAELRQAQKLEAVGTLASGIAHDFSNLLTALYGYIEDARDAIDDDHPARKIVGMIEKVADEASGVTRSLLTFTHKSPTEKAAVNLADVVEGALHLLRRVLPASVRIRTHLDQREHAWINGDAAQLQQIVMNLAINARDAMPDGGELDITVQPSADPGEAEQVEMIVTDTGVGMSDKVIARIFEPFFTTKARGKGTGLGLSIIHGIVTDHNGRIEVESEPGAGTRFTIALPACAAPPTDKRRDTQPDRAAGHDELVLVAEDNDFVRELTVTALEEAGYRVVAADNARAIIDTLDQHRGDARIAILDVDLPDMSGVHCLTELRSIDPDLPAIMVTGRVDQVDVESLPPHTCILPKPFQMPMLIDTIRTTLQTADHAEAKP